MKMANKKAIIITRSIQKLNDPAPCNVSNRAALSAELSAREKLAFFASTGIVMKKERDLFDLELDFCLRYIQQFSLLAAVPVSQFCSSFKEKSWHSRSRKNATTMNFIATFSTPCPIMVAIIVM